MAAITQRTATSYIRQHAQDTRLSELERTIEPQVARTQQHQKDMRAALAGDAVGLKIEQLDACPDIHPSTKLFLNVLHNFQKNTTPTFKGAEHLMRYADENPDQAILFYMEHTMMTVPDTGTIAGELAKITKKPVTVFVAGNITWSTGLGKQVCHDVHIKPISAKAIKEALARGEHVLVLADGFPGANRANDCIDDDKKHPRVIGDANGEGNFPRDLLLRNEALTACSIATQSPIFHLFNTEVPESVRTVYRPYSDPIAHRSIAPFTVTPSSLVTAVRSGHHYLHGGTIVGPIQPPTQSSADNISLSRIKQILIQHAPDLHAEIEHQNLNQLTLTQIDQLIEALSSFKPQTNTEKTQSRIMPLKENGLSLLKAIQTSANVLKLSAEEKQVCTVTQLTHRLKILSDEASIHNSFGQFKPLLEKINKQIQFLTTREFSQNKVCHPALMGTPGTHVDDENSIVFKTYQMMKQLPQDIIDFHAWATTGEVLKNRTPMTANNVRLLNTQRKTLVENVATLKSTLHSMDSALTKQREKLITHLTGNTALSSGCTPTEASQLIQLLSAPHTVEDLHTAWPKLKGTCRTLKRDYEIALQKRESLLYKIEVDVRMLEKLFVQNYQTGLDFLPERIEALDIPLLAEEDKRLLLDHDIFPENTHSSSAKLFAQFYASNPVTRSIISAANYLKSFVSTPQAPELKPLYQDAWDRLENQSKLSEKHLAGRQAINERNKTPHRGPTVAEIGVGVGVAAVSVAIPLIYAKAEEALG